MIALFGLEEIGSRKDETEGVVVQGIGETRVIATEKADSRDA